MPSKTTGKSGGAAAGAASAAKGANKTTTQAVQVAAHAVGADKLLPFTDTMQRQVLMDKLSEFLMVEQGGLQLYRVAAGRALDPELRARYEEFGRQTEQHRAVLLRLIMRLGGDPNYVSPTARLAQVKADSLLESALKVDGLSAEEIAVNDIENVLLAETKDNSDWKLMRLLAEQCDDAAMREAMMEAVGQVEAEEDTHYTWALEQLSGLCLSMVLTGPTPSPERWQRIITGPVPPITAIHPAPMPADAGLLGPAQLPMWGDTPITRAVTAQGG